MLPSEEEPEVRSETPSEEPDALEEEECLYDSDVAALAALRAGNEAARGCIAEQSPTCIRAETPLDVVPEDHFGDIAVVMLEEAVGFVFGGNQIICDVTLPRDSRVREREVHVHQIEGRSVVSTRFSAWQTEHIDDENIDEYWFELVMLVREDGQLLFLGVDGDQEVFEYGGAMVDGTLPSPPGVGRDVRIEGDLITVYGEPLRSVDGYLVPAASP